MSRKRRALSLRVSPDLSLHVPHFFHVFLLESSLPGRDLRANSGVGKKFKQQQEEIIQAIESSSFGAMFKSLFSLT